jgi:hypothetical protein
MCEASKLKVMVFPVLIRLVLFVCVLAGAIRVCAAQAAYTPPPPPLTTLPPCPVPKDAKEAKKIAKRKDCDPTNRPLPAPPTAPPSNAPAADSAAQRFPYPGEQPAKPADVSPAKAFPFPGEAPAAAPAQSAAKRFPYPGGSAPATAPTPTTTSPAPESSSSSTPGDDTPAAKDSGSSSASSDDDDDDGPPKLSDKGSEGKLTQKTVKPQTDSERVDEDLRVAKFYGQSGNPMGAYLRAKDAVKTEPDLPEARFVMGEAANRLNKKDEAKAEFGEYLRLAPDGEHARAAEKNLSKLN